MRRLFLFVVISMFTVNMAVAQNTAKHDYKALNPWAEVDPIPLKGISPRVDSLSGKKIGIFANYKRAAVPIANAIKTKLETGYPDAEISLYHSDQWNVVEADTVNKVKFTEWAEGVDAVVLAVGD